MCDAELKRPRGRGYSRPVSCRRPRLSLSSADTIERGVACAEPSGDSAAGRSSRQSREEVGSMPWGAVMAEATSMGSPSSAMAMAHAGDRRGPRPPRKIPQQPTRALVRHHWGHPGGMDWFIAPAGISPRAAGGADVRIGEDTHKIIGDRGASSHGGGLCWSLWRGRRPPLVTVAVAAALNGPSAYLQTRRQWSCVALTDSARRIIVRCEGNGHRTRRLEASMAESGANERGAH